MHRYRVAGLALDSDIILTGLAIRDDGIADLRVRLAGDEPIVHASAPIGPGWSATPEVVTLDIAGIARLQAVGGNELRVAPIGDIADAEAFVVGTGIGILLQQRGDIVLRGTAIERDGGGVLFTGPAGVGMSTLAMALVARGDRLVADDLCRLTFEGAARVAPSGTPCQLWRPAIEWLGVTALERVRPGLDRFHVAPGSIAAASLPLREVFVVRTGTAAHPAGIEAMPPLRATVALYAAAYRPALVAPLKQDAAQFRAATLILRQAVVRTLTVPRGLDRLDETMARLEAHWAAA